MTLTFKRVQIALLAVLFAATAGIAVLSTTMPVSAGNHENEDDQTCKDLENFTENLEGDSSGAWGTAQFKENDGPLVLTVNDGYTVTLCVKKGSSKQGDGPKVLAPFVGPLQNVEVNYPGANNPADGFSHYALKYAVTPDEPRNVDVCDPTTGDIIEVPESEENNYKPVGDEACQPEGGNGDDDDEDEKDEDEGEVLGETTDVTPTSLPETGNGLSAIVAITTAVAGVATVFSMAVRNTFAKLS